MTDVDEQIVVRQPRETQEARDAVQRSLDWQDDSAEEKAGDDR
jgi:hypothetical protein